MCQPKGLCVFKVVTLISLYLGNKTYLCCFFLDALKVVSSRHPRGTASTADNQLFSYRIIKATLFLLVCVLRSICRVQSSVVQYLHY